ncbi:MAG: DUF3368 domain-containing protein [Chloroflexi bacterium HGW-Chloroflexi-1]|nr:MAG: DUF3368 domain-containing protein [Chloroflexi bacterium HGW-Chloroflexi-1]
MTVPGYVANSSPLIVYGRIGQMGLLRNVLGRVCIPPVVRREVFGDDAPPEWIEERALTQPLASRILVSRLGPGESEAIALAMEIRGTWLILDDLAARRLAESPGIPLLGSLGLLLKAKDQGLITSVAPLMEAMRCEEFRFSDEVFTGILAAAGEI